MTEPNVDLAWTPEACTLPTAQRPLRVTEFDDLFAQAVREVSRPESVRLRLVMSGPAGLAETVRDLTAREAQCCSFFTFTTTPDEATTDAERLVLDVEVPPTQIEVLDGLAARAAALMGRR